MNSVLQMNMGQGKTSCVMPMVSAILANGTHLVRTVVPKSLLLQTAQIVHSRLGGLVGRELRHIPFSRKILTSPRHIQTYHEIHKVIRESRGAMITVPEHMLSFKLSGLQRTLDQRIAEAKPMVDVQNWIEDHTRDILDECDVALAVRTQLIYPSGTQTTVDGHPHRWQTCEALSDLVQSHIWHLQKKFPRSVEIIDRPEAFQRYSSFVKILKMLYCLISLGIFAAAVPDYSRWRIVAMVFGP